MGGTDGGGLIRVGVTRAVGGWICWIKKHGAKEKTICSLSIFFCSDSFVVGRGGGSCIYIGGGQNVDMPVVEVFVSIIIIIGEGAVLLFGVEEVVVVVVATQRSGGLRGVLHCYLLSRVLLLMLLLLLLS